MEVIKFDSKVSWAVAMACAFMNVLLLIPTKVSGLFFVEILDRYKVSRNLAGYPTFTITLMRCTGGPIAGLIAERIGINEVMILGSLLAAVGISACFFAEDIAAVIVCLGFIHGLGLTLTHTFFPQIMKIHFKKHLTLAYGVTQAGSCLGSFLSPPLLLVIFQSYGTSGGFLIIGAMVLNCLPIAMILNILSPKQFFNKSGGSTKSNKCPESHLETQVPTTKVVNAVEDIGNSLEAKAEAALALNRPLHDPTEIVLFKSDGVELSPSSDMAICQLSTESDEKTNEIHYDSKEKFISTELTTNNYEENLPHSKDCPHSNAEYKLKAELNNKDILKYRDKVVEDCHPIHNSGCNKPPYASISNISASRCLVNKKTTQKQITKNNEKIILTSFNPLNKGSSESNELGNQEINQEEKLQINKKPTAGKTNAKKSFKIFLDVTFLAVLMTQSLYAFVVVLFWTTMIDFSRDKRIDRSKEVYLLMILPISEMIGRLGLGWITDRKYLTRINFSIVSFILMGCSCSLMAWGQGFIIVMTSIFMFGIITSGLTTVFPMILFEFFDSTKQTMAQASRFCLYGPLSFLNGPLIGYFRGTLGSYVWLYHTLAMASIACGALSALIPVLARMRDEKKKPKESTIPRTNRKVEDEMMMLSTAN